MAGESSFRVQVHPADDGGCLGGHYRLIFPGRVLLGQGHDVVLGGPEASLPGQFDGRTHQLVGCAPVDADVVVLQRPLKRVLADLIPHLQAQGVAVVVEVDDDFTCIPPANPCWSDTHPRRHPDRNWDHLARACRLADLVTVSTPALAARYGGHGRVVVLPNFVPAWYLGVQAPENDAVTVGWAGSPHTHPGDLEVMGGAVSRVLASTGAGFRAVGSAKTLDVLDVEGDVVEWAPLLDGYPQAVATLDVGVVPLADSAFNRGKSSLKMAESAALGVAVVASPTPENVVLHRLGVGMLARKPREWEGALRSLVLDVGRRAEMVAAGREVMAGRTYEQHAWRWAEAWEQAVVNRRGRRAA